MRPYHKAASGFSLVEIMVGLLVSVLSTLVVAQVFTIFEGQKRTVTAGGDALSNGAIALYTLLRDARQGGYEVSSFNLLGCALTLRTGVALTPVAPVTINPLAADGATPAIPAGDANSDILMVVYGNGGIPSEGDSVANNSGQPKVYTVQTPSAYAANDRVIVALGTAPLAACAGVILDKVTAVTGSNITVQTGGANANNASIYNLGSAPKVLVYAIRNGNLTVCEYLANDCGAEANKNDATVWVPMVSNIVSLRAQYGRDTSTPMDGVVDAYNQTPPTNNCEWLRVSSVRVVLVARSGQPDCPPNRNADGTCPAVTANAPTWAGSADIAIDLSGMATPTGFDWHNFRYRVFETTVPIRNIMLMGAQTGC